MSIGWFIGWAGCAFALWSSGHITGAEAVQASLAAAPAYGLIVGLLTIASRIKPSGGDASSETDPIGRVNPWPGPAAQRAPHPLSDDGWQPLRKGGYQPRGPSPKKMTPPKGGSGAGHARTEAEWALIREQVRNTDVPPPTPEQIAADVRVAIAAKADGDS